MDSVLWFSVITANRRPNHTVYLSLGGKILGLTVTLNGFVLNCQCGLECGFCPLTANREKSW